MKTTKKNILTFSQLKKIIQESIADYPEPKEKDFEEPESDDDAEAKKAAYARGAELKDEIRKFLSDNKVVPFQSGRDYIRVDRYSGWSEDGGGYWSVEVYDVNLSFKDNGEVWWNGGSMLSGFNLSDDGDNDEESLSQKNRFRFIQKMMEDKEFVKAFRDLVQRVGNETEKIKRDMQGRYSARMKRGAEKYSAAQADRLEKIRNEVKNAEFALIEIASDDRTGIIYRGRPCKIIDWGNDESELQDIMYHPWLHEKIRREIGDSSNLRVVKKSQLKGI